MATIDKLAIFLLCLVTVVFGEFCVDSDYNTLYCSSGCCGPFYDQYCCWDGNTGTIVGIVIGCLAGVGAIITVIVIICCCCRKNRGAQGQVMNPVGATTVTTTTVGGQNVYPVASPAYPGTYPYGQPNQNEGFTQPYPLQPAAGYNDKPPPYATTQ